MGMLDKAKIVEKNGVAIYYNSDSNVLKNIQKEFTPAGTMKFAVETNKQLASNNVSSEAARAFKQLIGKPGIWKYIIDLTSSKIRMMKEEGIIVEDNAAKHVMEYITLGAFITQNNEISHVYAGLNSGYTLNMDYLKKYCGTLGYDLEGDTEKLFGMVKSYWNLKKDEAEGNKAAIDTLGRDIVELNKKMDNIRYSVWDQEVLKAGGAPAFRFNFGALSLTDPRYRDIIFYKDPWIAFSTYMDVMTSAKSGAGNSDYYDAYIQYNLRSLMNNEDMSLCGGTYPLTINYMFLPKKGFMGSYKFIRPDGKTF